MKTILLIATIALLTISCDNKVEHPNNDVVIYRDAEYTPQKDTISIVLDRDTAFEVYVDTAVHLIFETFDATIASIGLHDNRYANIFEGYSHGEPDYDEFGRIVEYPDYVILKTSAPDGISVDTLKLNKTLRSIMNESDYIAAFEKLLLDTPDSLEYIQNLSIEDRLEFFSIKKLHETDIRELHLIDVGRLTASTVEKHRMLFTLQTTNNDSEAK